MRFRARRHSGEAASWRKDRPSERSGEWTFAQGGIKPPLRILAARAARTGPQGGRRSSDHRPSLSKILAFVPDAGRAVIKTFDELPGTLELQISDR